MPELIQQKAPKTYEVPDALFFDTEEPEKAIGHIDARANAARYIVASAFSQGLRRRELLLDIARTKIKPEEFVKSVIVLWGKEVGEGIDEIDVMYKSHQLGVFDEIFTETPENTEVVENEPEENTDLSPNDEELLELEQELQAAPVEYGSL